MDAYGNSGHKIDLAVELPHRRVGAVDVVTDWHGRCWYGGPYGWYDAPYDYIAEVAVGQ